MTKTKLYIAGVAAIAISGGGFVAFNQNQARAEMPTVTVYKSASCGCCGAWIEHMKDNGFKVEARDTDNVAVYKEQYGVSQDLASCHTAEVDGYVLEGHVPADVVERMLEERPEITGLAVPGMPMGSPGMEGPYTQPYNVIAFGEEGQKAIYESR